MYEFLVKTQDLTSGYNRSSYNNIIFSNNNIYNPPIQQSGIYWSDLSANSQTLCEGQMSYEDDPIFGLQFSVSQDYSQNVSGDGLFYKNPEILEKELFFNPWNTNEENVKLAVYQGQNSLDLESGILQKINEEMSEYSQSLSQLYFFLNGQRIYPPDLQIINNTGIKINFEAQGRIWAKTPVNAEQSIREEIFWDDSYFKAGCVKIYWNGMVLENDKWIEAISGIPTINKSIKCKLSLPFKQNITFNE